MKTYQVTVDGVTMRFPESTSIVTDGLKENLRPHDENIKKFMDDIITHTIKKMAESL